MKNFLQKPQGRKISIAFITGVVAMATVPRSDSAFFSVYVLPSMVTGVAIGITIMLLLDIVKNWESNATKSETGAEKK